MRVKAKVLQSLRRTLDERGYVEVETPVLQHTNGGAAARPFHTHVNAFDEDALLRIALELHLKRSLVGGIDRVYEIGKTFRNEGVDNTHNPEFMMLEAYEAYGSYDTMAEPVGETVDVDTPQETLTAHAARLDVALQDHWGPGEIVLELFEKLVEHTLVQPTFVCDYPEAVRPLAKKHRSTPGLVEAWDLIINGVELAPAYTELNDPVIQRERLATRGLRPVRPSRPTRRPGAAWSARRRCSPGRSRPP